MKDDPQPAPPEQPPRISFFSHPIALGAITLCGLAAVVLLFVRLRGDRMETIEAIKVDPSAAARVNRGQVIPAVNRKDVVAREGWRYEVIIDDESDDGVAGVAHLGGLVTFVKDARPGERVIIEVTRLKARTAEAVVVNRLAAPPAPPASRPIPSTPVARNPQNNPSDSVVEGAVFDVEITDVSRKNPDREGVAHIDGLVVFVAGGRPGDRVKIRIISRKPHFAVGEIVERIPPS